MTQNLSNNEMIDIFFAVQKSGDYKWNQNSNDIFQPLSCSGVDPKNPCYQQVVRTLVLSKEILLVLTTQKQESQFGIIRTLPDNLELSYEKNDTLFYHNISGFGLSRKGNSISFTTIKDHGVYCDQIGPFRKMKRISPFTFGEKPVNYTAECDLAHLFPFDLFKYTNNKHILEYFLRNKLVNTIDA